MLPEARSHLVKASCQGTSSDVPTRSANFLPPASVGGRFFPCRSTAAKAESALAFSARLKSCPDTKQNAVHEIASSFLDPATSEGSRALTHDLTQTGFLTADNRLVPPRPRLIKKCLATLPCLVWEQPAADTGACRASSPAIAGPTGLRFSRRAVAAVLELRFAIDNRKT